MSSSPLLLEINLYGNFAITYRKSHQTLSALFFTFILQALWRWNHFVSFIVCFIPHFWILKKSFLPRRLRNKCIKSIIMVQVGEFRTLFYLNCQYKISNNHVCIAVYVYSVHFNGFKLKMIHINISSILWSKYIWGHF